MTEIRSWMKSYAEKAEELFPGRILDAGQCPDKEFARLSNELLTWASEWIQGRAFSKSPEKEEGLS